MSNETKRDVFDGLLKEHCKTILDLNPASAETDVKQIVENVFHDRYAAALPDDLPVIPKEAGVSIKEQKAKQSLGGALFDAIFAANELGRKNVGPVVNWMVDNDETYANAWLTGAWRVEETGEIVKLEAEK